MSSINSYVSLTFEAWIKRNGTGDWDAIINYDGWNSGGIHWQIYSSNVIGFSLNGSNPTDSFSTYTITDTSWHYIVNTYDSTANTDKFYLDGQFSSQTNYTTAISAGLDSFRIGGWSGGRTFNGAIDEVRISNTARSADWIKAQYNSMTDAYISYGSEESLE
ncbi:MAG: LamG domain-containing protein [bacterium]|nr:LamG domain-containing protein [bacterium]